MKLREETNKQICNENKLPFTILTNVVEEENSKNKMRATSNLIAKALIATLGPYGSSTIIQDRDGQHFATKDGYDLMNRMSFNDEVSRTILDLFKMTASNQVLTVGDGSTSAIVVANALFQTLTDKAQLDHFKRIAPKDIVDILNMISDKLEEELKKMAIPISKDMHELDTIASIANNNDTETGKLIGNIYREIGEFGFISMDTLEKKSKDTYEIKKGIEWDRGYIDSIYGYGFENERVIYDKEPKIILSNSTITYDDLQIVMMTLLKEAFNQEGVQVLIVANDFDADAANFFKANRTKHLRLGGKDLPMDFTVVDIDQITKESKCKLEDLALLCGCKIYDKMLTKPAEIVANPSAFIGRAEKVIITKKKTQVIGSENLSEEKQENINRAVSEYKIKLMELTNKECQSMDDLKEIYSFQKRISNLTASSAILHVGGKTMAERMTRQRLIEDAIFACKSTLKYGYIPGGNICIPKILKEHKKEFIEELAKKYKYLPVESLRVFLSYFIDLIIDSFLESYRAVLNNSYMNEDEVEKTIETCLSENKFYNLKLHSFEDFTETSVINSVDTDIQILKSCMSIIGILSTSNQFITLNFAVMDNIEK